MTGRTLPDPVIEYITYRCNLLPEVRWDRWVPLPDERFACVYGWIKRSDGRSDFVLLQFGWGAVVEGDDLVGEWCSMTTSSAEHSADYMRRIDEADGNERRDHDDYACIPVDKDLPGVWRHVRRDSPGVVTGLDFNITDPRVNCPQCGNRFQP